MSQKYEKLKTLLQELFQLDQPDLDFGLYRIMHAKSAEVSQFLDKDLLPQVKAAFGAYKTADKVELEKELGKLVAGIQAAGMDPEQSPKVKDLRAQLASEAVDIGQLESEVYDHLFSFFRRYYSEGDFLAKRVYKPGVYAIPYEGEEVTLYWANKDQYYIKTSEYLRDYAFRLRPDDDKTPMRVHFRLVDASEGEHGNVKPAEGKERRFKLLESGALALEDGDLVVRFTYQPDTAKQKELNVAAESTILANTDAALAEWIAALSAFAPTEKVPKRTLLAKQLQGYSDRNTFDYFIHKDLGGFLRRELDFYIKNEVMHLDDVENENAPRVEQYLSKIKVIRKIAGKIIAFLAQLEDFQKKLWLKKKFVVETQWCIALSLIPDALYREIAENDAQREEWVELMAIDESGEELGSPKYSIPLTVEFLRAHSTLLVDTRFFGSALQAKLIASLENLDDRIDGILINGDNFHALSLVTASMGDRVSAVYIDPPYNTGSDSFMFRDNYRHSSWLSMISNRLDRSKPLLREDGVLFSSIDANERSQMERALEETFGKDNRIEEIVWVQNTTKNRSPTYSTNHEYVEVFAKNLAVATASFRRFREPKPGLAEMQELLAELNPSYPPLHVVEERIGALFAANKRTVKGSDGEEQSKDWKGLYNYSNAEYRDARGGIVSESEAEERNARIWVWRESDTSMPQVKEDSQRADFREHDHPEYRFYTPAHPSTGKACPAPKRGWAWPFEPFGRQVSSFSELASDHRIVWGVDETKIPQKKSFLHETETNVSKSVVVDFSDGEKELANLFGRTRAFSNPKPTTLIEKFVRQTTWTDDWVLDFFAGSGTTGHAVINVNRSDARRRRLFLVESGDHFDSIVLPRIKKVTFTPAWKDGKPTRPVTPEEAERSPRIVKVVRLESYEDALNNLETRRTEQQQLLLDAPRAKGADGLKEQYLLRYLLEVETRGSHSLLNVQAFADPTSYKLKVKRPGSDETGEANVDLLETFNWLIGLTVQHIAAPQTFSAAFERDSEKRLRLSAESGGRLKQDAGGPYWFRIVTGTTPDGRKTLVIWRKLTGEPEEDNLVLDEWFTKQGYSARDSEFDLIYVNGGNNLENLKTPDDRWKVRLLEEDFHRLMFDTEGG